MRALNSAQAVAGLFSVGLPGFAGDNTVKTGKPADYGRAAEGAAAASTATKQSNNTAGRNGAILAPFSFSAALDRAARRMTDA